MSSILTTALLGSAVTVGSILGVTFAQDSQPKIKPCLGELCPPSSQKEDVPDQGAMQKKKDTSLLEQMKGPDEAPGQVVKRKKQRMGKAQIHAARAYRISCGEGRAIVAQRFNRVRVIECRGRSYSYRARRNGETFRIRLDSRTGRIVGRMAI